MMIHKTLLHVLVFLGSLHSSVSLAETDCPLLCLCTGNSTSGITVLCDGNDGISVFPSTFPASSEVIIFENVKFTFIPISAFPPLPKLVKLEFVNSTIDVFRACSFAQIQHVEMIHFKSCDIGVIQGNSFSNLFNVTFIQFTGTSVREILSYAFHNLKNVSSLILLGSRLRTIHPFAFQDFSHVRQIEIRETTIDRFMIDGFSKFHNVSKLVVDGMSVFHELHCRTLDTVPTSGGSLQISDSHFTCDCKLAWVWERLGSFSNLSSDSTNFCRGEHEKVHVTEIDIDQMCPDKQSRDIGCRPSLPSTPHTCSRGDEIGEPVSKVTYPTYFSRTPPNRADMLHGSMALVSVLLCMVFRIQK